MAAVDPATNHKEFDLLAGHELGQSTAFPKYNEEDPDALNVLVWHKLETEGYQPAAREGHTSVAKGLSVTVFGGFEAGKRDNSVITLDVANCRWKLAKASGDIPPARCYHTAAVYNNLMIIHGGEGIPTVNTGRAMAIEAVASVDSEEGEVAAPHNRSFTRGSVVDADRAHDQLVSGRRREIGDNSLFSTDESDRQLNGSGAGRVLSGKDVAASAESCAMDHAQAVGKSQAGPMHGVTLGDTLTSPSLVPAPKIFKAKDGKVASNVHGRTEHTSQTLLTKQQQQEEEQGANREDAVRCLDDVYALDLIFMEWYKIDCILAPLPRKGHTMCVGALQGEPHAIIFGGYSSDNLTLSNSVHVCRLKDIELFYQKKRDFRNEQQKERKFSKQRKSCVEKITALRSDSSNKPLVWRTLNCSGVAPAPRYRHSASIVAKDGQPPLLVVVGGIGADPSVALSDVHVLDLDALTWVKPLNGSDALARGAAGDGPSNGLFGHVAFPVMQATSMPDKQQQQQAVEVPSIDNVFDSVASPRETSSSGVEILVFGGNSDPTAGPGSSNAQIYALNLDSNCWRRVPTGHAFPSARSNHAASIVHGWAPANKLNPPASKANAGVGTISNGVRAAANNATSPPTASCPKSCLVMFGGMSSTIRCTSDTWALDLQWRCHGVEQYDTSVTKQEHDVMLQQQQLVPSSEDLLENTTGTPYHTFKSKGLSYPIFDTAADGIAHPDRSRTKLQGLRSQQYYNAATGPHGVSAATSHVNPKELRRQEVQPSQQSHLRLSASSPSLHQQQQQHHHLHRHHQQQQGEFGSPIHDNHGHHNAHQHRQQQHNNGLQQEQQEIVKMGHSRSHGDLTSHHSRSKPAIKTHEKQAHPAAYISSVSPRISSQVHTHSHSQNDAADLILHRQHSSLLPHAKPTAAPVPSTASLSNSGRAYHADTSTGGPAAVGNAHLLDQLEQHALILQYQQELRQQQMYIQALEQSHPGNAVVESSGDPTQHVYLKMRKERAQSEILLQGERGRLSAAEVRITELQGALAQREQELHAQKLQYDADVSALQQSLSKAHEREKYLKELNTEAYQLLEMYGANKIVM